MDLDKRYAHTDRSCAKTVQKACAQRADQSPQDIDRAMFNHGFNKYGGILQQRESQTGHKGDREQCLPFGRDKYRIKQNRQRFDQFFRQRRNIGRMIWSRFCLDDLYSFLITQFLSMSRCFEIAWICCE